MARNEGNSRNAKQVLLSKLQSRKQKVLAVNGDFPLLRELSALSRAPSLRDPSASSRWNTFENSGSLEEDSINLETGLKGYTSGRKNGRTVLKSQKEGTKHEWDDTFAHRVDRSFSNQHKHLGSRDVDDLVQEKCEISEKIIPPMLDGGYTRRGRHQRSFDNTMEACGSEKGRTQSSNTKIYKGRLTQEKDQGSFCFDEDDNSKLSRFSKKISSKHDLPSDSEDCEDSVSGSESGEFSDENSHSESPLLYKPRNERGRQEVGCTKFCLPSGERRHYKSALLTSATISEDSNNGCGVSLHWPKPKVQERNRRMTSSSAGEFSRPSTKKMHDLSPTEDTEGKEVILHASTKEIRRKHQNLSQKYRPKSFRDMVGQNILIQALSNAVLKKKVHPFYIFYGPHGTGKTTAARIFAAGLLCLSAEEHRPCGVCQECHALHLGKTLNLTEVDSSCSMKKLLKDVYMHNHSGRFQVFIIDDCHMLSEEAWMTFLKGLEEPPGDVIFILITSCLEQLPATVASRCQKFYFSKIKDVEIINRLQKIALKEDIDVEYEALQLISSRSNGSLRDAETTLEQLGLLGEKITCSVVQDLVGMIADTRLEDLLDLVLSGDIANTVKKARQFMDSGIQPSALMSRLATQITDRLAGFHISQHDQVGSEEFQKLRQALRMLSEAEKQVRASNDQSTWFTANLLQFALDRSIALPISCGMTSSSPSLSTDNGTPGKDAEEWNGLKDVRYVEDRMYGVGEALTNYGAGNALGKTSEQSYNHKKAISGYREIDAFSSEHPFHGHIYDHQSLYTTNRLEEHRRKLEGHLPSLVGGKHQRQDETSNVIGAVNSNHGTNVEDIWQRVLRDCPSGMLKQLLLSQGRLVSISTARGFKIAYLEFINPEYMSMAEALKASLLKVFENTMGCRVELEIGLANTAEKTIVVSSGFGSKAWERAPPSGVKQYIQESTTGGKISLDEHVSGSEKYLQYNGGFVATSPENWIAYKHDDKGRNTNNASMENSCKAQPADMSCPESKPSSGSKNLILGPRLKPGGYFCWKTSKMDDESSI